MRWKNLLFVVAALLAINLPAAHGALERHRLSADGVDVRASLVQQRAADGISSVTFAVPAGAPERGDPGFQGTARVARATYDAVAGSGVVPVRVLPGSTTVWRVDGQVTSRAGLVVTLVADLVLIVLVVFYTRFGHRLRAELVLVAADDLTTGSADPVLDRLGGQRYLVSGVIVAVEPDAVVLDVGGRRVRVLLEGHGRPGVLGEPASAVGTMIA